MDQKQFVLNFIKQHKLCVIATVSENNAPEAAVLEFGETQDLELVFDTFKNSRKYKNLQKNSKIAVVIGWGQNITVQYEGEASEVLPTEIERYILAYTKKNPEVEKWSKMKDITYFKIIPKWLRYTDINKHPWYTFEIDFEKDNDSV